MPNEDSLHPKSGVRFLFQRMADHGDHAAYDAAILTPDARVDYAAVLREDGGVELVAAANPAEPSLEKKLTTIAVVIARGAKKKRANGLAAWPPRVQRWRDA